MCHANDLLPRAQLQLLILLGSFHPLQPTKCQVQQNFLSCDARKKPKHIIAQSYAICDAFSFGDVLLGSETVVAVVVDDVVALARLVVCYIGGDAKEQGRDDIAVVVVVDAMVAAALQNIAVVAVLQRQPSFVATNWAARYPESALPSDECE